MGVVANCYYYTIADMVFEDAEAGIHSPDGSGNRYMKATWTSKTNEGASYTRVAAAVEVAEATADNVGKNTATKMSYLWTQPTGMVANTWAWVWPIAMEGRNLDQRLDDYRLAGWAVGDKNWGRCDRGSQNLDRKCQCTDNQPARVTQIQMISAWVLAKETV